MQTVFIPKTSVPSVKPLCPLCPKIPTHLKSAEVKIFCVSNLPISTFIKPLCPPCQKNAINQMQTVFIPKPSVPFVKPLCQKNAINQMQTVLIPKTSVPSVKPLCPLCPKIPTHLKSAEVKIFCVSNLPISTFIKPLCPPCQKNAINQIARQL